MALLEVENIRTYFYTLRGVVKAVDGVSFKLEKGETLGIVGESGCGKSTLAWSLLRLVPPPGRIVGGQIRIDGKDIVAMSESEVRREIRWKRISMIFQGAMNALNPVYTVGDQIIEPLLLHTNMTKHEALERARELIEAVGLAPSILERYPHELSGGQKQRVVIAMALALKPDIVIADEPTTALDVVVQAQILNLMKKLHQEEKMSIILITHDLGVVTELSEKIAVMYAGKIVEFGSAEEIFENPLHPYTKALIRAVPRLKGDIHKLEYIPGTPPDLRSPPPGCRFAPRCPRRFEPCDKEEPPIIEYSKGHYVACWLYSKR
ncbi:MAG: ABC transporter ATP-binding protein [Desulfurococcales archaeon]|nr:ABC transporter ATP-binding protein [Desulfurococcales archaeon]MEB3789699.1 ABC transporter ATP-binding protein [Desulfurococcales archaeon]